VELRGDGRACFYSFGSDTGFVLVGGVKWGFGLLITGYFYQLRLFVSMSVSIECIYVF
jgi:hypothetical protein